MSSCRRFCNGGGAYVPWRTPWCVSPTPPCALALTLSVYAVAVSTWIPETISSAAAMWRATEIRIAQSEWNEGAHQTRLLGFNAGTAPYTLKQYGYSWGAQPL